MGNDALFFWNAMAKNIPGDVAVISLATQNS